MSGLDGLSPARFVAEGISSCPVDGRLGGLTTHALIVFLLRFLIR
jgi:hypothetical protein